MQILRLFSELIPCLFLGYLIGRSKPGLASHISRPLVSVGVPLSLIGLLLKSGLDGRVVGALSLTVLVISLLIFLIRITPNLRGLIETRTMLLGSAFGNSGYFGIPVSLALLPSESLSFSIGYDLATTLLVWTLGPLLMARSPMESQLKFKGNNLFLILISSPACKGLVGAFLIQLTPWSDQIGSFLWFPSRIVIVLALLIVGMSLGRLSSVEHPVPGSFNALLWQSLSIKLVALPFLMLVVSRIFGLSNLICKALVLQSATPTAISVLLLAQVTGEDQEIAATLVVWSTLIAIVTVPLWSLIL